MPRNVKRYVFLVAVAYLTMIPQILLMPPLAALVKLGITLPAQRIVISVATLVQTVVQLPIFYLAVWRRKNWARWTLFLLFAASLPFLFIGQHEFGPDYLAVTLFSFVGAALEAVALYFLFTGDARPWFQQQNSK